MVPNDQFNRMRAFAKTTYNIKVQYVRDMTIPYEICGYPNGLRVDPINGCYSPSSKDVFVYEHPSKIDETGDRSAAVLAHEIGHGIAWDQGFVNHSFTLARGAMFALSSMHPQERNIYETLPAISLAKNMIFQEEVLAWHFGIELLQRVEFVAWNKMWNELTYALSHYYKDLKIAEDELWPETRKLLEGTRLLVEKLVSQEAIRSAQIVSKNQ